MKLMTRMAKVLSYVASLSILWIANATTSVFAETAKVATAANAGGPQSTALSQILLLAGFILIFYFFIVRPQSKRAKEQKNLISGLQKGDEVLTAAGIVGKITKITDNFFVLMIAEGTEILIQKQAVTGSLPKGTMKSN